MSNSLDSDQTRRFVRLDLDPNCLHRLSADDISRQRVKVIGSYSFVEIKRNGVYDMNK